MSLLTDMEARLVAGGYTGTIALARLPDQPDEVLALREYQAEPSRDRNGRGLPALERRAVQMVVRVGRDAGLDRAELLARQAYFILSGRHVDGAGVAPQRYDWLLASTVPTPMGYDDLDRPVYVCSWDVQMWGDLTATEPEEAP